MAPAIVVFTRDNFNPRQSPCRVGANQSFGGGAAFGKRVEWFKGDILYGAVLAAFNKCETEVHALT
jgi:hypothetical protein